MPLVLLGLKSTMSKDLPASVIMSKFLIVTHVNGQRKFVTNPELVMERSILGPIARILDY